MTFKEYLIETALTSLQNVDVRARGKSDFEKLGLGKKDGSKPSKKRSAQLSKRQQRAIGFEEEEEPIAPARRERVQRMMNTPAETDKQKPSIKRQVQRGARTLKSSRGIGSKRKNALQLDEL